MEMSQLSGVLVVVVAGLLMGSGAWPIKIMKKFKYEHFAFVSMLIGLIIVPWTITLIYCPHAIQAYKSVDSGVLIKSNIFSFSWGIANILCFLCFIRIGFCLTGGILTGVGVSFGVITPMVFKGSGLFKNAPDITSTAGITVLAGVAVMILGVIMVSLAGFGREKALRQTQQQSGSFLAGLLMAIFGGIISCGISFAFVYSQGPVTEAMKAQGAGEIPANFAVWAVGLIGGAMINILYPAWLMTKNKSWNVLFENTKEILLAVIMGANFCISVALMGKGMLVLGTLGASVGFGVQQAMQMLGGQSVGFIAGEWKAVTGKPRWQMYFAIFILIVAAIIMAYGNSLVKS